MSSIMPAARLLLVEDEALIALAEKQAFARAGYEVEHVLDGESAIELALKRASGREPGRRFDLVLMDIDLGAGIDGGEAARRIRAAGGPPVVFLSSRAEDAALAKTRDAGGYGYILKGSGERIVLASVRMALGLARVLRELSESEERWESLARTAPDYIVSIGADRRILSLNRPLPGLTAEGILGHEFTERIVEKDKGRTERKLDAVFFEGRSVRALFEARFSTGLAIECEAYIGPVFEAGQAISATAVLRDVSSDSDLIHGSNLTEAQRREELDAAISYCDFSTVEEYLLSFQRLTGAQAAIMSRGGWEILASGALARACVRFHARDSVAGAACVESNRELERSLASLPSGGFVEHHCANGLRDMALPLFVDGMHWGSLYLGQFLYDDDEVDEAKLASRARERGWEVQDYLAAMREIPRFSRAEVSSFRDSLSSFSRVVSALAQGAYRARLLERYGAAAESARDESDRRYRLLAQNVADVIWTIDPATMRFTYVSPSVFALRGFSPEEVIAESVEASLVPESYARAVAQIASLAEAIASGDPVARETHFGLYQQYCKDGSLKWIDVSMRPIYEESGKFVEVVGVTRDATEHVAAEAKLKAALADKDRLYAELQHRVKNSLALISSLISLSSSGVENESTRESLAEAQARVRSIGLLYEQLYKTRSVEDLELGDYLASVARAVVEAPPSPRGLRFESSCESFRLATDRAVTAGLLLYELAANAAKHAFAGRSRGLVRLELRLDAPPPGTSRRTLVSLRLEDDGVGLAPSFNLETEGGLGSNLIRQLASQLGGSVEAGKGIGGEGSGFLVRFPLAL
jgi:PAS domain S-box-containing protein